MGLWSEEKKSKGRGQRKQHGHEEIQNIMYHAFTHTHTNHMTVKAQQSILRKKRGSKKQKSKM